MTSIVNMEAFTYQLQHISLICVYAVHEVLVHSREFGSTTNHNSGIASMSDSIDPLYGDFFVKYKMRMQLHKNEMA